MVNNLASSIGLSPDNRDATVDRFWNFDVTGNPVANITYNYAASELPASPYNDPFTMKAQRYEPSSDFWMPYFAGQAASPYSVTSNSVSSFGTYTLTNQVSPLPVTWLSFTAYAMDKVSKLKWSTATETNSDRFVAERSADGRTFSSFVTIPAAGNSTSTQYYEVTDEEPFAGISFYRIQQIDYDGAMDYSGICAVRHDNGKKIPDIFPSPASDFIFTLPEQDGELQIREMSGRLVIQKFLYKSDAIQQIDISSLAVGMYLVSFSDGPATRLVKE
jgi:hypothetical protein